MAVEVRGERYLTRGLLVGIILWVVWWGSGVKEVKRGKEVRRVLRREGGKAEA